FATDPAASSDTSAVGPRSVFPMRYVMIADGTSRSVTLTIGRALSATDRSHDVPVRGVGRRSRAPEFQTTTGDR
ncbi:MAG: hypothetical protein OXD36_12260, partial [Rhodobacter sp.]|nr:hypothetical protein [Rhodobacter sp.]